MADRNVSTLRQQRVASELIPALTPLLTNASQWEEEDLSQEEDPNPTSWVGLSSNNCTQDKVVVEMTCQELVVDSSKAVGPQHAALILMWCIIQDHKDYVQP